MGSSADEVTEGGVDDDAHYGASPSSGGVDETLADAPRRDRGEPTPAEPDRIGRYRVIRRLGTGGMGVVYEAHDEKVDRRVALKLLRGSGSRTERLRLVREAQALAQLSHPHVVQVFEVGTLGERAFLVMELVDGTSLDRWLQAEPRSVRERLAMFVQAGEGLAAAHAAGLVHRDFKPGNVLVGRDGRVRVVDFGLARVSGGPLSEETSSTSLAASPSLVSPSAWAQHLTHAGAMLGTPAYMSPEQLGTEPVTAASDQFSFCVALYQALWQQHPFADDGEVHEVVHNVLYGHLRPPPLVRDVPPRLRAAVLRGLASDPQARWPSMNALVHELHAVSRPSAWPRAIAAALVAVATTAGVAWVLVGAPSRDASQVCTGADAKLASVWGPSHREAVERAFHGTGLPYAAQTWSRVGPRLDGYAEAWRSIHAQACEAGPDDTRQLDLRMACLERLRGALAAQVQVLEQVDPAILEQAVAAVDGLRAPEACLQPSAEATPAPDDPALASLSSDLDRVEALERSGKYQEALALAEQVLRDPRASGQPLEARGRLALGRAQLELGAYVEAELELERAYFLAQRLEQHELVQRAAERLVSVVGVSRQDHERGLEWARHAEAALERGADPYLRAEYLASLGSLHRERGEYTEALRALEESLRLYRSQLAPDRIEIAEALGAVGIVLRRLERRDEALHHQEQALAIAEAALGPEHPEVASMLNNLATAQLRTGHKKEAATTMARAIAIREAIVGADPIVGAQALTTYSVILSENDRHDEAEQAALRAIAILEDGGTQPHTLCAAVINLANARHTAGRYQAAATAHRRAVVECEAAGLEDHLDLAQELYNFGQTLEVLGELDESDAAFRRAISILERSDEDVSRRIMLVYDRLVPLSLARGRFEDAIADADRWLALEPKVSTPPYYRALIELALARAHLGAGRSARGLEHAREAARRAAALTDGKRADELREEIRAFRAEHDPLASASAQNPRNGDSAP